MNSPIKSAMGIRGRLVSGFSIIAVILIVVVLFTVYIVSKTQQFETTVLNVNLPTYNSIIEIDKHLFQLSATQRGWLLTHDEQFKIERAATLVSLSRVIMKIEKLTEQWNHMEQVQVWKEIKLLLEQYKIEQDKVQNIADSAEAIQQLMTGPVVIYNQILTLVNGPLDANGSRSGGLLDVQYKEVQEGTKTIVQDMKTIKFILFSLLITTIVVCSITALLTARKILKPLNEAIDIAKQIAAGERTIEITSTEDDETGKLLSSLQVMQASIKSKEEQLQLSEEKTRTLLDNIIKTANEYSAHSSKVALGDLTQRLNVDNFNEMAQLGNDLNLMTVRLAEMTKKITEASNNMTSSLDEVKHASEQQSIGVTEQASSINEITASLEEIDKSASQTMEKAKILGRLATQTSDKGQAGLDAVKQSIDGMKSVREKVQTIATTILALSNQTQQVGEITAVVNTLAQQSKMLALNAAIEAAKAGEAGKGFAVVATEIKNLAEQSEQSTVQVQKILEEIRQATEKAVIATEEGAKGVDQGTGFVEQMDDIVRSLVDAFYETMIASQQIEAAVRQESLGIEQITVGMNEINQVTTSFVTTVKQSNESINQLGEIAKNIKEYVDVYSV